MLLPIVFDHIEAKEKAAKDQEKLRAQEEEEQAASKVVSMIEASIFKNVISETVSEQARKAVAVRRTPNKR